MENIQQGYRRIEIRALCYFNCLHEMHFTKTRMGRSNQRDKIRDEWPCWSLSTGERCVCEFHLIRWQGGISDSMCKEGVGSTLGFIGQATPGAHIVGRVLIVILSLPQVKKSRRLSITWIWILIMIIMIPESILSGSSGSDLLNLF